MTKDTGGAAFGFVSMPDPNDDNKVIPAGMTLRDYFAGQALGGFTALVETGAYSADQIAKWSYTLADAMLTEKDK